MRSVAAYALGMAGKPTLNRIGALLYACSECGDKIELDPKRETNEGQRTKRLDTFLAKHIRDKHSEDVRARRVCPECGHEFQGSGWDGIDAHWRANHAQIMAYEEAWPLISADKYRRKREDVNQVAARIIREATKD